MEANNLKEMLNEGIVTFTFTKKNGEIRQAKGTRRVNLLLEMRNSGFTEDDIPKNSNNHSETSCPFWDLDKHAWRSACINKVISIDEFKSDEDLYGKNMFA